MNLFFLLTFLSSKHFVTLISRCWRKIEISELLESLLQLANYIHQASNRAVLMYKHNIHIITVILIQLSKQGEFKNSVRLLLLKEGTQPLGGYNPP